MVAKGPKLRVYGCTGFRSGGRRTEQTREIVAATSKKAARVLFYPEWPGYTSLDDIVETGNRTELAVALGAPGVVFWKPLNSWGDVPYTRRPRQS